MTFIAWIASLLLIAMMQNGSALSPVVMQHILRQDDGKLNQSAHDLFAIVLIPRRLVNQLLLSFFGNRVDVGGGIVQKMADDLL